MQKQPDAFIVTVIKQPEKGTTLADVIVGSLGITGVLVLASLVLAAIVAFVRVRWSPPCRVRGIGGSRVGVRAVR